MGCFSLNCAVTRTEVGADDGIVKFESGKFKLNSEYMIDD